MTQIKFNGIPLTTMADVEPGHVIVALGGSVRLAATFQGEPATYELATGKFLMPYHDTAVVVVLEGNCNHIADRQVDELKNLAVGDVWRTPLGAGYMKVSGTEENLYAWCVDITTGEVEKFDGSTVVQPMDVEFVFTDIG